jgi:hypothetical protein
VAWWGAILSIALIGSGHWSKNRKVPATLRHSGEAIEIKQPRRH